MEPEKCAWKYDDHHDYYNTSCGNFLVLIDGSPEENGYLFCPCCGKVILEVNDGLS